MISRFDHVIKTSPHSQNSISGYYTETGEKRNCWITLWKLHSNWQFSNSFVHSLTTPWSKVRLEKLTSYQLVKIFPAVYANQKFITAFTKACHLSISWTRPIQYMPPNVTSWRSFLILTPFMSGSSKLSSWHLPVTQKPKTSKYFLLIYQGELLCCEVWLVGTNSTVILKEWSVLQTWRC